ncbi:MAG: hypothetical protein HC767_14710 [Akkermansiaceae bacterium]|nr:hypothetical protein [Akkermansiaceae bacterium]
MHDSLAAKALSALSSRSFCAASTYIQSASAAALAAVGALGLQGREGLEQLQMELLALAAMHATVTALQNLPERSADSSLQRVQVRGNTLLHSCQYCTSQRFSCL